ncbi:unnamed protein product [Cyprideis torosa]|uniref:Uncharacterized protein n=1 Tax=Cyprideis torosa TaxID=163714 RepID=A0A7R8ZKP2_9CRUS|nr:unnamed protein product [Cyprideis torosa]CAG0882044.1 unnamed protein product [Cyprideis torosa]
MGCYMRILSNIFGFPPGCVMVRSTVRGEVSFSGSIGKQGPRGTSVVSTGGTGEEFHSVRSKPLPGEVCASAQPELTPVCRLFPLGFPLPLSCTCAGGSSPEGRHRTNGHSLPRDERRTEAVYDIPQGATTENLPPGVLYQVRATYRYQKEDVDELSFDIGEIINVVEYDDIEDQEEGWLMGVKENTGEKGLFPANFTRPM